jgi:hypothetical protein
MAAQADEPFDQIANRTGRLFQTGTDISKCFLAIWKYTDVGSFPSMGSEMNFE